MTRAQTAVEFAFLAALVLVVAMLALPLVTIWRERVRAERLADQVAVLVAEHRPVPGALTRGAHVRTGAGRVVVAVPVTVLGQGIDVTATARTP